MSRIHRAARTTLAVLLPAAAAWTTGCDRHEAAPAPPPPIPVVAVKAVTGSVPDDRSYPGTTQSPDVVIIDARVRGELEGRFFREGDDVDQGDLLYLIQPDEYEADVARQEAEVRNARTNVDFARREYERNEPLAESGAISQQEWDRYERTLADAEGRLAAAEASLANAELNLSYCRVEAPVSGRIGNTLVNVGNVVGPGSPSGSVLARIVSLDRMQVYFSPGAHEYPDLERARQQGRVRATIAVSRGSDAPLTYDGHVDLLDNLAQSETSTFLARAVFESPDRLVLPGQYARVTVHVRMITDAVLVPTAALIEGDGDQTVHVVDADGKAARRVVTIGRADGAMTQILSGLKASETVIVTASPQLKAGDVVNVTMMTAEAYLEKEASAVKARDPGAEDTAGDGSSRPDRDRPRRDGGSSGGGRPFGGGGSSGGGGGGGG